MSDRLVLDASMVLAALLGEQETGEQAARVMNALKEAPALVPAIWQAEVANVLVVKERQGRITESFLAKAVRHLGELPVEVDELAAHDAFLRILPLARRHQLTVYDASYLELAMRRHAAIATFDRALRGAAERENVEICEGK